jgi:hypothetical protein
MHSCWCFVFLSKFDENWSCSVKLCMNLCSNVVVVILTYVVVGLMQWVSLKCWIVVSMIFNEWNKLIMMSYGIMIFCFWLLFGNEKWFGRNRDFHMRLSVNRFGKWVWCEVMENDFWDGWNLNFSIHYDRAKC